MIILFLLVSFIASSVGAISGIGGGIIIKPVLDSLGIFEVTTISFLSGCTVLTMSTTTLMINIKNKVSYEKRLVILLAIGSAMGGFFGSQILSSIKDQVANNSDLGLIQTSLLLAVNLGVVFFLIYKNKIKTLVITSYIGIITVGLCLGLISSFLGIGGGPINIAVLFYFFSLSQLQSARSSLVIIFFAQLVNLLTVVLVGHIPQLNLSYLLIMCIGGVSGGILGTKISTKLSDGRRTILFKWILLFVILVNVYNLYQFGYKL